jgi:plasmid stability protein
MGTVTIRNLDDEVIERAKQRASSNHRSLEAELREIITRAVKPLGAAELLELADRIAAMTPDLPQPDSVALLHEGRDWLAAKADAAASGDRG